MSGKIFVNGKVEEVEASNFNNAVLYPGPKLANSTIASGESTECYLAAMISLPNLTRDVYYKYLITYEVDGITKNFYYTIKILADN